MYTTLGEFCSASLATYSHFVISTIRDAGLGFLLQWDAWQLVVTFVVLGAIWRLLCPWSKTAFWLMAVVSVLWAGVYEWWGVVTMLEQLIGYMLMGRIIGRLWPAR